MTCRVVFCTFADSRLRRSLVRIRAQAEKLGVYSEINAYDESTLDAGFRQRHRNWLVAGSRGFGYWIWKPHIVREALRKLADGDVVHYADSGCWLNDAGRERFHDYLGILEKSESGILAFQIHRNSLDSSMQAFSRPEKVWTKGDLLDHFGVRDRAEITDTEQIAATTFLVRKSPKVMRMMDDWLQVWDSGFGLVDDSPSRSPNLPGFIEHRHDQSAFSILAKLNGAETVSYLEIEYPVLLRGSDYLDGRNYYVDWSRLQSMPIQARRDKDAGMFEQWRARIFNRVLKSVSPTLHQKKRIWGFK